MGQIKRVKQTKEIIKKVQSIEDELVNIILECISDAKIEHIIEKKCHGDYFVGRIIIGTGTSVRHIAGSAERLSVLLKKKYDLLPDLDVSAKEWVILICGSIAVHLMTAAKREHYKLEELIESLGKHVE